MTFKPEGFSLQIFKDRYAFTESETWEEACQRVARQMASAENSSEKIEKYMQKFFEVLVNNEFVPGGRIWYNSGRPNPQLLNCFVLGHDIDSRTGWARLSYENIVTSMTGGGCGQSFSEVRPNGAMINGQKGTCPGPVELMRLINHNGKSVKAGGGRRTANMFSLDLRHPDIEEFLDAKLTKGELDMANVSVESRNTTKFIEAVKNDEEIELSWKGQYKRKIKARKLWDRIVENAYNSAEPGFLNMEFAEKENNIWYLEKLVTSNPCLAGDTLTLTRQGYKRIDSILNAPIEIWNGFEWSEVVPKVTGYDKELLEVTFSNGASLRCTKNHTFKILVNGVQTNIEAQNLTVGMVLINYTLPLLEEGKTTETLLEQKDITIKSILEAGIASTVYCFTEYKNHTGIFNGVLTGQCGEILMPSYDSCCLGHIVLTRFVSSGEFDWAKLADTIRTAVRFLDNVLSVNTYPLPEMKNTSSKYRRIGVGTTALADMLILLGYKYGSDEGNKFVDKLFRFISKAAYEASIMLAIEKGPFPSCDPDKHVESGFMKRMPKKIRALIKDHGIRNCAILTQAPVGSVSIVSGNCSSGIEPIFAFAYWRNFWKGDKRERELCFHPLFKQFLDEGKEVSHFTASRELSIRDHLEIQKIVQSHIDNAISKTINISKQFSDIKVMSELWLEYLPYLKGTTFYREGSRNYIDENGVEHEPPLVEISLEEALRLYAEQKENITEEKQQEMDCPTGVCGV